MRWRSCSAGLPHFTLRSRRFSAVDSETGEAYFVSPRSGDLVVLTRQELAEEQVRARLRPLALDLDVTPAEDPLSTLAPDPGAMPVLARDAEACRCFLRRIALPMRLSTRFMALDSLACYIASLHPSRTLAVREALGLLRSVGEPPRNQCLQTSFMQAVFLVRHGVPLRLHVGVWIPTTWMHAWVTVPAEHGGTSGEWLANESVDRIAHYQPVLRFEFDCPRA
ncbi:lasso peptide biosynthesis protein [Aquabacterium sp. UBA2148]|jgi:hypothetical protein|uniref:lasso peptide biosynthesis protein n=1 Tax=Aquabacterium sp. UBA2148 TaxID=1946042 RepID=UPI00257BFE9D|nr:lasso peptide biosynthesis protein [Aquabacterium sp. UBA2148]